MFSVAVIISTYNNPAWLEKTLIGYTCQTCMPTEIIVADDGSKEETKTLIDSYKSILPITHVWHEDDGFQKSKILNKAILSASSDYLIFTDQDCIPRNDFIETHIKNAQKGYFLSAGNVKLSMELSNLIKKEDILSQEIFSIEWLRKHGDLYSFKKLKLVRNHFVQKILNTITPSAPTFNGCNSSCWKDDIIAINGYNEDMHYGGQDRELGLRLLNNGVKAKMIRFSAAALHLDHKRPYKTKESVDFNKNVMRQTIKNKTIRTENGISKS